MTQLVIQLLPLPRELISIIKEHTFYHKDYILARQRRQHILDIIHHTRYKQWNDHISFLFWSENKKDYQFQSNFCTTCGNYTLIHGEIPMVVECTCLTNNVG
jgi:hypothetical protein